MSSTCKSDDNRPDEEEAAPTASFGAGAVQPGGQIGPYKLLRVLGEGGFAIVYLAEQTEPVKRRVALKILKPGMDSRQVLARFEAERQAIALLDHPNIAQIYDAGATEQGRPYFAMEHVKGVPLTEHCDRHKLSIEERLCLFLQVCEAIHHAHQKGIIHRDLKPTNVIVQVEGDHAIPKVIDFGVAKATSQPLTERTLFTEQGQLIGTPEYMSPEQAEMTNQDIDTRSDIYSLGVLLYELLSGALPFDHDTLEKAALDEVLRIIREQDPPRPSAKLSGLGEQAKTVAGRRRTEVRSLVKRLHNELEWIPLKAMRKEPAHRYRTAVELADDITHYLSGEPLTAGPESVVYRVKKFVRRNRTLVAGVAAVLAVPVAAAIVWMIFAARLNEARKEASELRRTLEILQAEKLVSQRQAPLSPDAPLGRIDSVRIAFGDNMRLGYRRVKAGHVFVLITMTATELEKSISPTIWFLVDPQGRQYPMIGMMAMASQNWWLLVGNGLVVPTTGDTRPPKAYAVVFEVPIGVDWLDLYVGDKNLGRVVSEKIREPTDVDAFLVP